MTEASPPRKPVPPREQAGRFLRAREVQAVALLEDYAEMIGDLIAELGEARVADIAERMGVAQPTATKAVARLKREGLAASRTAISPSSWRLTGFASGKSPSTRLPLQRVKPM